MSEFIKDIGAWFSSSKKTLRIWAIFLFGKCTVLHI